MIIDKTLNNNISSNWVLNPDKDYFTHDDLINAYLIGKEEQQNENQKILIEKLDKNIKKAQMIVETINKHITKSSFTAFKSYLRINNIIKFDAIFDISLEDYTSEKFDKIYKLGSKLKKEQNTDTFNINFTFMPHTENLNEKRLICEGFIFKYEQQG